MTDYQGHLWDPRLNRDVVVLRVLSVVDPKTWGVEPENWRRAVREACDSWERSGICAFIVSFDKDYAGPDYPLDGVVFIRVKELDDVFIDDPGHSGYANSYVPWWTCLSSSALVWIDEEAMTAGSMRYTLAHELGHVLGLGHLDAEDSVMHYNGAKEPTETDFTVLRELYS
jgi:hypothetical protein